MKQWKTYEISQKEKDDAGKLMVIDGVGWVGQYSKNMVIIMVRDV